MTASTALLAVIAAARVGDPLNPATTFGPVISKAAADRILPRSAVPSQTAPENSSPAVTGSPKADSHKAITWNRRSSATSTTVRYWHRTQQTFGPVVSLIRFSDDAEAVRIANDTCYGLNAFVHTRDLTRAHTVARQLRPGRSGLTRAAAYLRRALRRLQAQRRRTHRRPGRVAGIPAGQEHSDWAGLSAVVTIWHRLAAREFHPSCGGIPATTRYARHAADGHRLPPASPPGEMPPGTSVHVLPSGIGVRVHRPPGSGRIAARAAVDPRRRLRARERGHGRHPVPRDGSRTGHPGLCR